MNSRRSHHGLLWAYQIAAVCLLILTVTPCTAPFATCDLPNGVLHVNDADSMKDKMIDDSGVMPLLADVVRHIAPLAQWDATVSESALGSDATAQLFPLRL
jgi:hypothetical protein